MILLIDNYDSLYLEPLPVSLWAGGRVGLSAVTVRSRWLTMTRWHPRKS